MKTKQDIEDIEELRFILSSSLFNYKHPPLVRVNMDIPAIMSAIASLNPASQQMLNEMTKKMTETPEGRQQLLDSIDDPYMKEQMRAKFTNPASLARDLATMQNPNFDNLCNLWANGSGVSPDEMYQLDPDRKECPAKSFVCHGCADMFPLKQRKKCSKCKVAVYCSVKCQTKDWRASHKKKCRLMKDANKIAKKMKDFTFFEHEKTLESLYSSFQSLPPGFIKMWFAQNPYYVRAERLYNKGKYADSIPMYLKCFPLTEEVLVDHLIKKIPLRERE